MLLDGKGLERSMLTGIGLLVPASCRHPGHSAGCPRLPSGMMASWHRPMLCSTRLLSIVA